MLKKHINEAPPISSILFESCSTMSNLKNVKTIFSETESLLFLGLKKRNFGPNSSAAIEKYQ